MLATLEHEDAAMHGSPRRQPAINIQIARAYLSASDPKLVSRTWQEVMIYKTGKNTRTHQDIRLNAR